MIINGFCPLKALQLLKSSTDHIKESWMTIPLDKSFQFNSGKMGILDLNLLNFKILSVFMKHWSTHPYFLMKLKEFIFNILHSLGYFWFCFVFKISLLWIFIYWVYDTNVWIVSRFTLEISLRFCTLLNCRKNLYKCVEF